MKQLLTFIFSKLVDYPDEVKVNEEELEEGVGLYKVKVHPEDMGQVIGKRGRMIKNIRQLAKVKMTTMGRRGVIQLVEEEGESKD